MSTNFLAVINGQLTDLGNVISNQTAQSITLSVNDTINQQYSLTFNGKIAIKTNDIKVAMNGYCLNGSQTYTFGPARQRLYVGCGSVVSPSIGNTLAFSSNGTLWTGLGATIFSNAANGVAYNGKVWVAVGSDTNNSAAFSWNGKSWFGLGPILSIGYCVAWNGSLFVAGGTAGSTSTTLIYSYEGINWFPAVGTSAITTSVTALGWNGTMWQAGTSVGQVAYSYDGINWTLSPNVSVLGGYKVNDIQWMGSLWHIAMNFNSLLVYSTDGINWISHSMSGYFSMRFNQCLWNGVIMIGCGTASYTYAYTGTPLSNWWNQKTTAMTTANSIKWTGKNYILFGTGTDTIETVTCPINNPAYLVIPAVTTVKNTVFTTGTNFDFSITNPHSVSFPAYMVLAGGSNAGSGTMAYSYDGVVWGNITTSVFSTSCNTIKYNGRIWVAGGANGGSGGNTLAFSYNGRAWTGLGAATFSTACKSISWNGTLWVAVGNTGGSSGIAYSYDGLIWVPTTTAYFNSTLGGKSVAYNGKIFVAVGGGTTVGNSILTSSDGIQWTPTGQTAFTDISSQGVNGVSWNGSKWVAVGSGGNSIAYSYNGTTWVGLGAATFPTYGNQVAWNGKLFVATGQVTGSGNCAATSFDGITWSGLGKTPFLTGASGIVWDGSRWQMGNVAASSAAYSYDGRTWTPYATTFSSTTTFGSNYGITPIPYIQHPTVAVGYGANQIAYSDDGITWQGVGAGIFYGQANDVAWNGSMWIAVGSSNGSANNNTIAYSVDGINWTGLGGSIFSGSGNGIAWNGQIWIATGNDPVNTLAYSKNGIQWFGLGNSVFSIQGFGVAYNGTAWVALGQGGNSIAYSTNGLQWTGVGNPVFTTGTNIATNGTYWIASGSGGASLAYTTVLNGSSGWTPIASPFAYSGNGIAWNGQIWVATGADSNNMIAYSYDGLNWTPVANSFNLFQYTGTGVCWNGVRFIAGGYGYGQNSIVYSPDGINWYPAYDGQNYNIDPATGFYTAQIFIQCISVASNSNIGVPVVQSQLILNPTQNVTELTVSSAPYYQQGFTEISFKIEQNNMY
jgi:hypothetical protein